MTSEQNSLVIGIGGSGEKVRVLRIKSRTYKLWLLVHMTYSSVSGNVAYSTMKPVYINYSLRSMAALSGALLGGEAAERRAKEWRSCRPNLLAVSLPSPAYIA